MGDEDQSIYRWRGADVSILFSFAKDFTGAKVVRLERNYRSTQNILDAAAAVVANNPDRLGKTLTADFIKADGLAKKMLSALSAGDIDKADYKFFDPSEFWAVNMTDRMIDRYNSTIGNKGMWAKTVQWLKEAVEHMKGWIGTSDSPMLKALDKLLKSGNDDKVQSGLLNGMNEAVNNITSKSLSDRAKELHATANRLEDAGEGQSSRVAKLHSEARRIDGIGRDLKEVESSRERYGDKITRKKTPS